MPVKEDFRPIKLQDFLPYNVVRLAHQITRNTAEAARRVGDLNLSHWRVLAAVAEAPGRTAQTVVEVTPMDKGIVSRSVKALIASDLLQRKASSEDGRVGHLYLTAKGQRMYQKIAKEVLADEKKLLSRLNSAQRKAFERVLETLLDDLPA